MDYRGYTIEREIGAGAVSTVHSAVKHINDSEMRCAIKRVNVRCDLSDALRIGRSGAAHIAAVYDAEALDDGFALYMELLTPISAEMSPRAVARMGRDIADGLISCHNIGVIYARVRPSNVLRAKDGAYKLGDAATRMLDGGRDATDALISPPEVLRGGPLTESADIYALGMLMYRLLNRGAYPFMRGADDLPRAMAAALVAREPDPPQNTPDGLFDIIKTALKPEPDRYASAADMRDALSAYIAKTEKKAPPHRIGEVPLTPQAAVIPRKTVNRTPTPPGFGFKEERRGIVGWLTVAGLLTFAVCVCVFGAYWLTQRIMGIPGGGGTGILNQVMELRDSLPENQTSSEPASTPTPTYREISLTPRSAPQFTPPPIPPTTRAGKLTDAGAVTLASGDTFTALSLDDIEYYITLGDDGAVIERDEPAVDTAEYPSLEGFLLPTDGRIVTVTENDVDGEEALVKETQLTLRCITLDDINEYMAELKKDGWLSGDAMDENQTTAFAMYQKDNRFIVIDYFRIADECAISLNVIG